MDKRGQFYLVAAIIIVLVIFGLVAINNYAGVEEKESVVFDLGNQLGVESGSVVNFALYNKNDTPSLLEEWARLYVNITREAEIENWVFVYGNPTNITILTFTNGSSGSVLIGYDGGYLAVVVKDIKINKNTVYGDYVNVTFGNFTYNFNMKSGQNFAFLINKGGYVTTTTGQVINENE
jgi:hypothetical protein